MAEAMVEGDGKKRAGLAGAVLAAVKAAVKFVPRAPAVGTEEVTDPEEALHLHSAIQKVEKELADAEESWLLLQEDDSV